MPLILTTTDTTEIKVSLAPLTKSYVDKILVISNPEHNEVLIELSLTDIDNLIHMLRT